MPKKMLIDATHPEETRVVVVDGSKVEEFDFESVNKRQLAGNIYLAKVTRVEPSLQAAFVEYGGNRHGFLAFAEIHPDYYQIPVADREALLAAEEADAAADRDEEDKPADKGGRTRSKRRRVGGTPPAQASSGDGLTVIEPDADERDAADASAPAGAAEEALSTASEISESAPAESTDAEAPADTPRGSIAESTGGEDSESISEAFPAEGAAETPADAPAPKPRRARRPRKTAAQAAEAPAPAAEALPEAAPAEATAIAEDAPAPAAPTADDSAAEIDTAEADSAERPEDKIESVGAEAVEDEVRPRRARMRSYKIQEVIKVRQIMLVQVVKEERGNKGAALTTYLSLAGRYCVLMPNTARGGGISRKITSAEDRKKLKEIAAEFEVPKGMGIIIRTAGSQRTRAEIKRDYEFLLRQWDQIRELTLKSIAPTLIYEEGSLIKRSIRDLYTKDIDEILVEGEEGYREAKDYMRMLMPSHAKHVQPYRDTTPLFVRYPVESYLASMFNPTVQLKSGGYIVIGITEALVAIDVNSGRSTREGSIEETALKTNLEAADEIARQLRLRDLAGLIVIDFIDMDERRNNAAVEKRMKERLKNDRARIQMGRISGFGLMELSRQRLRPGMLEASTAPCPHCQGTGLIRSPGSLALSILREIEEEGVRQRSREVRVQAPVEIANFIINQKREHMAAIELRYGLSVLVEANPTLTSPDYRIEKLKTASRPLPAPAPAAITAEKSYADAKGALDIVGDDDDEAEVEATETRAPEARETTPPKADDNGARNKRRRGRRGGKKRRRQDGDETGLQVIDGDDGTGPMAVSQTAFGDEIGLVQEDANDGDETEAETITTAAPDTPETEAPTAMVTDVGVAATVVPEDRPTEPTSRDLTDSETAPEAEHLAEAEHVAEPERMAEAEPIAEAAAPAETASSDEAPAEEPAHPADNRPRRSGWWSVGNR